MLQMSLTNLFIFVTLRALAVRQVQPRLPEDFPFRLKSQNNRDFGVASVF